MANSNYSINMINDGAGNIGIEVVRNPGTLASNGTLLTIPHLDNTAQDGGTFRGGSFSSSSASNATPIVLTVTNTGSLQVNDVVLVSGFAGNTNANGTFIVSAVSANTSITLKDSAGNGASTGTGTVVVLRTTKLPYGAIEAAKRAILNDIASGN